MRSGTACASAPKSTSTIRCEVSTFPAETARGERAATTLPGRGDQAGRRQRTLVRRYSAAGGAQEHVEQRRRRDRLDGVDGAADLGRGAGEVGGERVAADGDRHRDGDGVVGEPVAVECVLEPVLAVGDALDGGAGEPFGVAQQFRHVFVDGVEPVGVDDLQQPFGAEADARRLRREVAAAFVRRADVAADDLEDAPVGDARLDELHRRDDETFLYELGG